MARTIRVAHSPDSDDAFMFYALATGQLDTGDLEFVHELQDIETLNRRALAGELEVTAVSIHAYAYLADRYVLLPHGASMGERYGPRLVAREPLGRGDLKGRRVAIPPTLLISALAHVPDVRRCVTMDLKEPGNAIYLIGATRAELAGAHLLDLGLWPDGIAEQNLQVPRVDLAVARQTFAALHRAMRDGLVRACHDLSEGGLAVAAAEMCIAGDLGLALDVSAVAADPLVALFSETPSRFLVEVRPQDGAAFEQALAGVPLLRLGAVTNGAELRIERGGAGLIHLELNALRRAWQSGLDGIDL